MTGGRQILQSLRGSIIKLGKMKSAALVKPQRRDWRSALGRRQNGSAEGLERGRSPDELYDEQKKIKMNTNTSKIIDDAENNITITKNLDNGACERCGCLWCEDDVEFENHMLFGSNKDGKNICRRCVREEDVNPKHHCLKCDKINEDWEEHRFCCAGCEDEFLFHIAPEEREEKLEEFVEKDNLFAAWEDGGFAAPVFPAVRRMLDIPEHYFTACDCDGKVWWFHRYEDRWYPSIAECGDYEVKCDACKENSTSNVDVEE